MSAIHLGNVLIDCPDAPALAAFYQGLLEWEGCTLYGHPALRSQEGFVLLFATLPGYEPPTWPEVPGKPQKQLHLDFQVPDVPAAVAKALALGAKEATRFLPPEECVTLLDPAGHPFCLCKDTNPL